MDTRPFIPAKKNKRDIDESSDTYDTIDWQLKNIDNNNGRVGAWGDILSGLLCYRNHLKRTPGIKGSVAAGAGKRIGL